MELEIISVWRRVERAGSAGGDPEILELDAEVEVWRSKIVPQ